VLFQQRLVVRHTRVALLSYETKAESKETTEASLLRSFAPGVAMMETAQAVAHPPMAMKIHEELVTLR
jgi:hypothetical protein